MYEEPNDKAQIITVLKPGSRVRSLTGEVHLLQYGRVVVLKDVTLDCLQKNPPEKLRVTRGQIVYVMEYLGEAQYRLWHQGRMCETWQGWETPNAYLSATEMWGRLVQASIQQWWVKIVIPKTSRTGWLLNPDAEGMVRL